MHLNYVAISEFMALISSTKGYLKNVRFVLKSKFKHCKIVWFFAVEDIVNEMKLPCPGVEKPAGHRVQPEKVMTWRVSRVVG
jgi:hypothetical protein